MKKLLLILMTVALYWCTGLSTTYAATLNVPVPYATIQAAIDAASPGDIIQIAPGTFFESSLTSVNKAGITIQGSGAATTIIQVSGTGDRFDVSANGVTIKDLSIEKTDKTGVQDIIRIRANNFTLQNTVIWGRFVIGDPEVSRAIVVNAGAYTGMLIDGNTFYDLRQPMYLSGTNTGVVSNNNTYNTKGWVLEGGNLTFTGNTWGVNVYDIAILGTCPAAYYSDIVAMSNANNNAVIENQRVSPAVLSVVYADASTSYSSDLGGRYHPYPSIAPAITRVVSGGKIIVAGGNYASEYLTANKSLTMLGANAGIHPAVGTHPTATVGARVPESIISNLSPAADNVTIDGFKFTKAGTRIIDTYANANYFTLRNCIVESTVNGPTTGIIQFGGGSHTNCLFEFNLLTDKGDHTFYAGGGPYDGLTFQYNKFQSEGDAIFWASSPLVNGLILHNEFDGESGLNYSTLNIGQAGNLQLTNNWFHEILYTAVQVGIINGSITGNEFDNHYGLSGYNASPIQLWGGEWGTAVSTNVTISNNEINYNQNDVGTIHGIRLRGPNSPTDPKIDGSTIHVHNNAFLNGGILPAAYAVLNQGDVTKTLDATCNWFGTTDPVVIAALFNSPASFQPYLLSGTDSQPGTIGFQPVAGACADNLAYLETPVEVTCDLYDIPVRIENLTSVGAINMKIDYNPAIFEYQGVTWNTAITGASANATGGEITMGWYSESGVTLSNPAILVTIHMKLKPAISGTITPITWNNLPNTGNCEFGGPAGNPVYVTSFFDVFFTVPVRPVKNLNTGLEYCTIQAAIDDPLTLDGHDIACNPGTYAEMVHIYKSIHLQGLAGEVTTTFVQPPATFPVASDPLSNIIRVTGAGVNAEISGLTIQGPGPSGCGSIGRGIFVRDGAYAYIHDNQILNVRDNPFSGCQNGIGIQVGRQFWSTSGSALIEDNLITGYQKGGIVVDNSASNATVTGNTITGAGTTNIIGQNGIQISRGATASLTGNTVTGNSFQSAGHPDNYCGTGILLYQSGAVAMNGGNNLSGNDQNYYAYDVTGALTMGAEIFGPLAAPVTFGYHIVDFANQNINSSSCTFETIAPAGATLAQLFDIEDRVWHSADDQARTGFVLVKPGNVYITHTETGAKVQYGVDAATALDVVHVKAATYSENVNITKDLTLEGANSGNPCYLARVPESIIAGGGGAAITVLSDGVTIDGFTITNPAGTNAVYAEGRNYLTVINNVINAVGNTSLTGATHAVAVVMSTTANITGITITDNCISDVHGGENPALTGTAAKNNNGSASGVAVGWSNANFDVADLLIEDNIISEITACTNEFAEGGKGAYGVIINVGASSANAGKAVDPMVRFNTIHTLEGLWSHGIGLEGETLNALVENNNINTLVDHKTPSDAVAVMVEDNDASATVAIHNNSFTSMSMGVVNATAGLVDATCNWYGTTIPANIAAKIYGTVNYTPWLVSGNDNNGAAPGFVPDAGSCIGTPVLIASAVPTDITCGPTTGSILVTWGGGVANYTVEWSPGSSVTGITGTSYTITPLVAGTYTITVTDAYGASDIETATINYLPVTNVTDNPDTYYATIQAAINSADPNEEIDVCAGIYPETLSINKAGLIIKGANAGISAGRYAGVRGPESVINGTVTLGGSVNGLTFDGFTVNATAINAKLFVGAGTGTITVSNNIFDGASFAGTSGIWNGGAFIWSVLDNSFKNFKYWGIMVDGNAIGSGTYSGNLIADNFGGTGGMVVMSSVSTPQLVTDNLFMNNAPAISLGSSNNTISRNHFSTGSGIFSVSSGNLVTENEFTNPSYAFYLVGAKTGNILVSNSLLGGYTSGGNIGKCVFGDPGGIITSTCNWWGTTDPAIIPTKGINFTFVPWLTSGIDGDPVTHGFQPSVPCVSCAIALSETHVNVTCFGDADGSIDLTVNGAVAPYTCSWTGPGGYVSGVEDPAGLVVGTYNVLVTADNGCTATLAVVIGNADATPPSITSCPPTDTFEGCSISSITPLGYSETAVSVTMAQFIAEGGAASDNCSVATITYKDSKTGTCPLVVSRLWTLKDGVGNATTCTQTINIVDIIAPAITCPPQIDVVCSQNVSWATEVADITEIHCTAPIPFNNGANGYYWVDNGDWVNQSFHANNTGLLSSVSFGLMDIVKARPFTITVSLYPGQAACMVKYPDGCPLWVGTITFPAGGSNPNGIYTIDIPESERPYMAAGSNWYTLTFEGIGTQDNTWKHGWWLSETNCANAPWPYASPMPGGGVYGYGYEGGGCQTNAHVAFNTVIAQIPGLAVSDNCMVKSVGYNVNSGSFFDYGTTGVLFTVKDVSGNQASCTMPVTVTDVTPPAISGCPGNINQGTDDGDCAAIVSWTEPTALDACDGTVNWYSRSHAPGSEFPKGTTAVTYVFRDGRTPPNESACSFTVTVYDDEAPVITLNGNATVYICEDGLYEDPGATADDNCDATVTVNTDNPVNTNNPATYTVTYSAQDIAGNIATPVTRTVIVNPLPVVQSCALQYSSDGINWSAMSGSWPSYDMCLDKSLNYLLDVNSMVLYPPELMDNTMNAFTLTATSNTPLFLAYWDGKGVDGEQTYGDWRDRMWLIINGQAPFFYVKDNGSDIKLIDGLMYFLAGNTGEPILTLPGDYPELTYAYTGTLEGANGCTSLPVTVSMTFTSIPVITCPGPITVGTDEGVCGASVTFAATAIGVPTPAITYSLEGNPINSGYTFPVGTSIVTATAANSCGNDACNFSVTVTDDDAPAITCPGNIAQENDEGECGAVVTFAANATDNCSAVVTYSQNPGTFFPVGTTPVTATATDPAGNTASCTFTVTITDTEAPEITCPAGLTISCDASQLPANTGSATATDNCTTNPAIGYTDQVVSGSCPGNYTINRTWTATDQYSNATTCVQVIIVQDVTAPDWIAPIFRRDMPLANVNNAAGSNRCNVGWADGANPDDYYTDDFKLGTSSDGFWTINKVVVWGLAGYTDDPDFQLEDFFNDISLYGANAPVDPWVSPYDYTNLQGNASMATIATGSFLVGSNTTGNPDITIEEVTYYNGESYQGSSGTYRRIWKVTFDNLNWTVPANTLILYGVNCTHKFPSEVPKRWFNHFTNITLGTAPYTSFDNLNIDFVPTVTPPVRDIYAIDNSLPGLGWDKGNDHNVRIYGVPSCSIAFNGCLDDVPAGPTVGEIAALFADNCSDPLTVTKFTETEGSDCAWDVTYSYKVEDACGNVKLPWPTAHYTGGDQTAPTITCPPAVTVHMNSGCDYVGSIGIATATDNCTDAGAIVISSNAPASFPENETTVTWTAVDLCGNTSTCTQLVTVVRNTVSGALKYNNAAKTPMNNVTLQLTDGTSNWTYITDDVTGHYEFPNLCGGDYSISIININKPVGYINSTDASSLNFWAANQSPIQHVKFNAGEVNYNSGFTVTALDALAIQNYFVYGTAFPRKLTTNTPWTFWIAGEFVNNNADNARLPQTFGFNCTNDMTVDIYGMGIGDFNGSFTPGDLKAASQTLELVYSDTRWADAGAEIALPVYLIDANIVGAASIIMNFPSELLEVTGVTFENSDGQLDWAVVGNELRIGWNTLQPAWFEANAKLLTIWGKTSSTFSQGDIIRFELAADPSNELADGSFDVIPDAVLGMDLLEFSTYGIVEPADGSGLTLDSRPNPFATYTTLTYNLPADGRVTIKVTDILGRTVATLIDEQQISGKYSVKLDALPLQPGVYTATLTLHNSKGDSVKTTKLVRQQ